MSPGLKERLAEYRGERGGDVLHGAAHRGGELEERLRTQAGFQQGLRVTRQLQLLLGDRPLARLADGHAERPGGLVQEIQVEAGLLGELLARIELSLPGQHALDREQRQAILRGRFAQLLDAEALLLEGLQEFEPRLAVARPVEEALGFKVDRHAHMVP